jgi:hypothetical protein
MRMRIHSFTHTSTFNCRIIYFARLKRRLLGLWGSWATGRSRHHSCVAGRAGMSQSQPGPLGQFAAPEARRHRPRVPRSLVPPGLCVRL